MARGRAERQFGRWLRWGSGRDMTGDTTMGGVKFVLEGLAAALFLSLLGGCQAQPANCDPSRGGFIQGLSGLMSGCYEQRIEDRRQALASSQALTKQLEDEHEGLQWEREQAVARLATLQRQLAALENDNSRLERQLHRLRAESAAQQAQKAHLEQEMQQINWELARVKRSAEGGHTPKEQLQRQIKELTQKRDQLASAIAEAMASGVR